jgi:hypothetical protein
MKCVLLSASLSGLIAGSILGLLTAWMAGSGPVGDGWSFRGNGALLVPLGLGPALLAGAWTALALRYRGVGRWRSLGVATTVIGALPAVASVLVLVLFGRSGQRVSDALTLPALAWPVLAPLIAAVRPVAGPPAARVGPLVIVLAAVAFTIFLVAGFAGTEVVVSPG